MLKKRSKAWMRLFSRAAFCLAMMALIVLIGALMASAEVYSGECGAQGDNVVWTLDTETGVLLIEGQGSTEGYSQYVNPTWFPYRDSIKEVTLSSGITNVGHWLFFGCKKLEKASLPDSVTSIEIHAFSGCTQLREVTLSENLTVMGDYAFSGCGNLSEITLPLTLRNIGYHAFASCDGLTDVRYNGSLPSGKAFRLTRGTSVC